MGERVLFDGLVRMVMGGHLISDRQSDFDVVGRQIAELHEGPERLVEVSGLLHLLRVQQEIRPSIGQEALLCADLADPQVRGVPVGHVPDHLLADRDRVVVEVGLQIQIDRLLVVLDCVVQVAHPNEQVTDAIV